MSRAGAIADRIAKRGASVTRCQGPAAHGAWRSFLCRLDSGHTGKCQPYTPPTVDEWRAVMAAMCIACGTGEWSDAQGVDITALVSAVIVGDVAGVVAELADYKRRAR